MKINLFKRDHAYLKNSPRLDKYIETALKVIAIVIIPLPSTTLIALFWRYTFYYYNVHFDVGMEGIVTSSWITEFGILYVFLAGLVATIVLSEYKKMRMAVKKWDLDTFMDLRDEEMSHLVYAVIVIFSLFLLFSFMMLDYPKMWDGLVLVSSTAYLLTLILFVITEIDDPCSGFWFIKSIPPEWLKIDPKEYRKIRSLEIEKDYRKKYESIFKKTA